MSWTGNGLPTVKQLNKFAIENGKKRFCKIQKKSIEEIKKNFWALTDEFLQHSFEYLVQQNSDLKNVFDISELKDLKIIKITNAEKGKLHLNLSTKFKDDLSYLLSKNWINKYGINIHKYWVTIHLYLWSLIIDIKQEK
jgi:hypothetical protein